MARYRVLKRGHIWPTLQGVTFHGVPATVPVVGHTTGRFLPPEEAKHFEPDEEVTVIVYETEES